MKLFKNKNILVVGDVMLDSYLFGNVNRISPEAPVPIVDILIKQDKLGGAANVAANIKNLGGIPILCSVIGKDQKGDIFLSLLKKRKISTKYIYQSDDRITTDKTRVIGNNHQMLRIDEEIKSELGKDQLPFLNNIKNIFDDNDIDCVLFQDYDKGVLNETIINYIIVEAQRLNIPTIVDPKKRNFNHFKGVTLFKPNFKEFKESINIKNSNRKELLKNGAIKLHNEGIEIVFVTLSENGIFISYKNGNKITSKIIPSSAIDVVDVSGAGDTVAAVTAMMLGGVSVEEIAKMSNIAGGLACEEVGVVPIDREKLYTKYNET